MPKIIIVLFIFNYSLAQQVKEIDFLSCKASLSIVPKIKKVEGTVSYNFKVLSKVDSLVIDAKKMQFSKLRLNNSKVKYRITNTQLIVYKKLKAGKNYTLSFNYLAQPSKAMYFIDWEYQNQPEANPQVWTQGQGKDNSNWIPSFDDMNEKLTYDLSITFNKKYQVVSNGKLISQVENADNTITWQYDMQQPMSSYLLAIAIGNYNSQVTYAESGVPLQLYYYPKDSLKIEPTYRYTKQMFDFLEAEIGVDYPWQNYKQIPVKDFLYAGMENTSATIFSDSFMVDSIAFNDRNYVNVNAHELAHQWFGNLVTATHGTHHWLQEGFATYYALLAEREVFGDDYYYYKLYETSQQLIAAEATDNEPLMSPKASSLTFYQKGAWALHCLRERVGDVAFKKAVKKYLLQHQYSNVTTNDFIKTVENESGTSLQDFKEQWLLTTQFPEKEAYNSLANNESIAFLLRHKNNQYLTYRTTSNDTITPSSLVYSLPKGLHYTIQQTVVNEALNKPNYPTYNDLLVEAFSSKELKLRQFLANSFQKIPKEFKKDYEGLLTDASYQTIEIALFNLWVNFPNEKLTYLEKTVDLIGFNDKNIRTLWLALALNTKGFATEQYQQFFKELVTYTKPVYHFEVRRNAFQYLNELQLAASPEVLVNLKQATTHHNWRFRSYCKQLLANLKME